MRCTDHSRSHFHSRKFLCSTPHTQSMQFIEVTYVVLGKIPQQHPWQSATHRARSVHPYMTRTRQSQVVARLEGEEWKGVNVS